MGNSGNTRFHLAFNSGKAINRFFLLCCALFFIALAHNHFQLITYKGLLDYNEGIMLNATATIAAGENPYSFENQPARMFVYSPLTNIIVAPLTFVFDNTLQLCRAVNGIFILASCLMCFWITYKASHSTQNSIAAALIFYAGLLFYSTPIAGPSGLGEFLFLSSVSIPWLYGFSTRSLIAGLVLGVAAFFAKQYFIASLGYISLYMFLAVSKIRAVIFGISAATLFIAVLTLVHYSSPYYIFDTIILVRGATAFIASDEFLLKQFIDYGKIYLPLFAILGILAIWKCYSYVAGSKNETLASPRAGTSAIFNLKNLNAPLLRWRPDYFWFCLTCSVAIIFFVLGENKGNYLTYLFHFISPFLLAGTLTLISRSLQLKWLYQLLLILAFYTSYTVLPRDFSFDQGSWNRLRQVVSHGKTIFASPLVLRELVERGLPIYYDGSTAYFGLTAPWIPVPAILQHKDPEKAVGPIWEKYADEIVSMLEHKKFDLVILDSHTHIPIVAGKEGTLTKYYDRTDAIRLLLANRRGGGPIRLEVWTPKPEPLPESRAPDLSNH